MTLSLEDAAKVGGMWLACSGCGTWHEAKRLKTADGRLWCVLCFPEAVT